MGRCRPRFEAHDRLSERAGRGEIVRAAVEQPGSCDWPEVLAERHAPRLQQLRDPTQAMTKAVKPNGFLEIVHGGPGRAHPCPVEAEVL